MSRTRLTKRAILIALGGFLSVFGSVFTHSDMSFRIRWLRIVRKRRKQRLRERERERMSARSRPATCSTFISNSITHSSLCSSFRRMCPVSTSYDTSIISVRHLSVYGVWCWFHSALLLPCSLFPWFWPKI